MDIKGYKAPPDGGGEKVSVAGDQWVGGENVVKQLLRVVKGIFGDFLRARGDHGVGRQTSLETEMQEVCGCGVAQVSGLLFAASGVSA